jgi:hypothetical protein
MSKYVVGFTGHFYVEADDREDAIIQIKDIGSTEPIPQDSTVRIDYVDWVI